MQTFVEIGPSNSSQRQQRRKDATEQMNNLTLARALTQVLGFSSADASDPKAHRAKIQVLPTGNSSLVGKASALVKPRTRVIRGPAKH